MNISHITTLDPSLLTANEVVTLLSPRFSIDPLAVFEELNKHEPITTNEAGESLYWLPVVIQWVSREYR